MPPSSRDSCTPGQPRSNEKEQGSAIVEFTFLALLLMVPLVYFVITVELSRTVQD